MIASADQVESIGSEDSVELGVKYWIDLVIEGFLQYLADEVDHCLEKILIFEDKFCLSMAQEDAHIGIAHLFALLFQLV